MHSAAIAVGLILAVTTLTANIPTNTAEEQNAKTEPKSQQEAVNTENTIERNDNDEPELDEGETEDTNEPTIVTVKPGETLAQIAERENTTYQRIFNANESLEGPNLIAAGDELIIPADDEELPDRIAQYRAERTAAEEARKEAEQRRRQERQAQESAEREATSTRQRTQSRQSQQSQPAAPQPSGTNTSTWDRLAECESNGNWSINTGNGYYGGLQFSLSSWRAVGGNGYPHQASKSEQIARGEKLQAIQGWGAWPACSAKLGLL